MEPLREFKYYDSNTGKEIKNPDYTLAYDKNIDKFIWYNKGHQPINFIPKYKVSATEGSETERKLLNRVYNDSKKPKGLDKGQIATKKWLDQKSHQAQQPQQTQEPQQSQQPQQQPQQPNTSTGDSTEKKDDKPKEKSLQNADAIVKNLSDSGALQAEVTKALVNANDIPIFTDDFDRIGKAINKLLSKATKADVFTSDYTVDSGTPVEKGNTTTKTAKDITKEIVKKYISTTRDPSGASLHTYNLLPTDGNIVESNLNKRYSLREDSFSAQATDSTSTGNPVQPSTQAGENTSEGAAKQASEQKISQPDLDVNRNEQTTETSSIVLRGSGMEDLFNKIASAVEPLVKEVTDTITSSAKAVKYHCSTLAAPAQTNEQATERKAEMNNSIVLKRLLEEEESKETTVTPSEESSKEAINSSEDKSREATTQEGEPKEEESPEKAAPSKAPTFPSTNTLKLIVDKLNKAGSPFETSNATYKLSYKMDNINPKDMSFDIIVTSASTTPKDGFWKTFGTSLKQHLKQAGANIGSYLGGSRGHMDI